MILLASIVIIFVLNINEVIKPINKNTLLISKQVQNKVKDLPLPQGFVRKTDKKDDSFANYLQNLPLKPVNSQVLTYDGNVANTNESAFRIIDLPIGNKNLLQCADALMCLRARYLYEQNKKEAISFNFVSGFRCDYTNYSKGMRFSVKTNSWVNSAKKDDSKVSFEKYLELVYTYASTISLSKELKTINNLADLQIGDVFIKGGSPGHCFIVVDKCENAQKQIKFAILQGFMPAQSMHILKNNLNIHWFETNKDYSYEISYGDLLNKDYHKRFMP